MPEQVRSEPRWLISLTWIALIGIGSACFHSTLRYREQLWDELPMYGLICTSSYVGLLRHSRTGSMLIASVFATCWVVLAFGLSFSPRESKVHVILRGAMAITFSAGFVYILTVSSKALTETKAAFKLLNKKQHVKFSSDTFEKDLEFVHGAAVTFFVVALLGWLLDNFWCGGLQRLPFGVPYPHLHGLVWHLGTACGLYLLIAVLLLHRSVVLGVPSHFEWCLGGMLPRVVSHSKQN
jgi:dihydroceramidase